MVKSRRKLSARVYSTRWPSCAYCRKVTMWHVKSDWSGLRARAWWHQSFECERNTSRIGTFQTYPTPLDRPQTFVPQIIVVHHPNGQS
ncbi:hypothetical protein BDR04DRAFT_300987 [Suillus decipiens]|nr:hypothetical protein BDR04DRAFT_300987 [Suillus decipiens]